MKRNILEPTSELAALEKTANNAQNRDTFFRFEYIALCNLSKQKYSFVVG